MKIAKCTFLAAAMLSMTACNNEDLQTEVVDTTSNCIVLSVSSPLIENESTRGTVLASDNLESIGLFGLRYLASSSYAAEVSKTTGAAKTGDFIHDHEVSEEDDGKYKTAYSWPGSTNKVSLFAYAPYQSETNGITSSTGNLTTPQLYYEAPTQAENQPDLIIADILDVSGDWGRTVPMMFKHVMAKVNVMVRRGTVSHITFKDIYDKGTYTFERGWENLSQSVLENEMSWDYDEDSDKDASLSFFMIPQTLSEFAEIIVGYEDGSTQYIKSLESEVWKAGETYNYEIDTPTTQLTYTGGGQVYEVEESGTYKLEVFGAGNAGMGGYATGTIPLSAGEKLFVYCGGMSTISGGYNGGGVSGNSGAGGCGATHIAKCANDRGELRNYSSTYRTEILLVAGGAGGSDGNRGTGGSGGGANGGQGGSWDGASGSSGSGGSQSASGGPNRGGFGYGGAASRSGSDYGAAGGGGFYGGGGTTYQAGCGGGGSGYVNTAYLSETSMANGVRLGHGFALITKL